MELYKCTIAELQPSNASNTNVIWSSSNPSVATVTDGVVLGINEGECLITASSAYDMSISAQCSVVVNLASTIDGVSQVGLCCWLDSTTVNAGETVWTDRSGNGNNATIDTGTISKDADNFVDLSANQTLAISPSNLPKGVKTYEYIFKPINVWTALFFCGEKTCVQLPSLTGALLVNQSNTSYLTAYDNPISIGTGSPRHLAIIMRENSVTFYAQGEFITTIEKDLSGIIDFETDLLFNCRYGGSDKKQSRVRSFRIYSRELSASEIKDHYNNGK